jgi:hypothetical protein
MRRALLIACFGASFNCACSFIFVKGAPASVEKLPPTERVECTSSKVAPVVDTLIAGYQVFRTGYALSRSDADYTGEPIKRNADIGFGVGLAALFAASSIYGYVVTGQCSEAKEAHERLAPRLIDEPAASQTFSFTPNRPPPATKTPAQVPQSTPAPEPTANQGSSASSPVGGAPAATPETPAVSGTPVPENEPSPSIP